MKTFEKQDLDRLLELTFDPGLFLEIDREYSRVHDDCEGYHDQCLKITLRKDASGNEFFELRTPSSHGLRFRNYCGGGASLKVHNALKVLIYSFFTEQDLHLPGLEREVPNKAKLFREIEEMLDGVIVLPPEVFAKDGPHYFFEVIPHLHAAISIDGDTHIHTEQLTDTDHQIEGETTYWNPEPLIFCLEKNCSRATFNAVALLTIAIMQSS